MDWFAQYGWMVWLGLALVLAGVEMVSLSLVFVMLSGGALAAFVAALLGGPAWLQGVVFALVSVAMIAFVRPIAMRHMRPGIEDARTNIDRLVGAPATVVEPVDAHRGLVKIGGDVWTARAERGEFLPGDTVTVVAIDGATAVVAPSGSTSPYRS
ncbi:NfeD family protein [Sinomonas mesophila]|uniref:NfeD family protein n=1 Tax=Sinomonas mesophila TaxID=1531955 RepID=UPI000985D2A6|nr:NfeD family protein [Sinomonas mesophila]